MTDSGKTVMEDTNKVAFCDRASNKERGVGLKPLNKVAKKTFFIKEKMDQKI